MFKFKQTLFFQNVKSILDNIKTNLIFHDNTIYLKIVIGNLEN